MQSGMIIKKMAAGNFGINEVIAAIVILIFLYNIRQGYKKGFLKQAAIYINTVIALVLAPIAMPVFITGLNAFGITHELEKMIQGYIDMYTYSHSMAGVRLAEINASNAALISQDEITKYIVAQNGGIIARNIVRTLSYAMGYSAIRFLMNFLTVSTKIITAFPVIHECDKALGAVAAGILTLLVLWLILAGISVLSFIPPVAYVHAMLSNIPILAQIKLLNPLQLLMSGLEHISHH